MLYLFDLLNLSKDGWLYGRFLAERDVSNQGWMLFYFITGLLLCLIVPYLLGSMNFAIIISKYKYKDDIRNYGSGNAGLTNMLRVYGKEGGLLTLAGDICKQIVSVWFGMFVFGEGGAYLAGTFCIIGHILPLYYKFRGGKGFLTAATMILLLEPVNFLILFLIFALTLLIFRRVSLGSVFSAFCYPILLNFKRIALTDGVPASLPALIFSGFVAVLIIITHRENLKRLYYNEEPKFSIKKMKNVPVDEDEGQEGK